MTANGTTVSFPSRVLAGVEAVCDRVGVTSEETVYDDSLGRGRTFTSVAESLPEIGDQIETVANRALLDAVDAPRPPRCGQCGAVPV